MIRHPRLVRNDSGFTLVEVLIALMLVAVLGSFAQPSLSGYLDRNKTGRALDQVASDLVLARTLAVREGNQAVLQFTSASSYSIIVRGAPDRTVREVSLADSHVGVELTPPTSDGQLVFNSRGVLVNPGNGRIVARLGERSDTASLTGAGRVFRAY